MTSIIAKKKLVEIISAAFILLFVYTASSKLIEIERFRWALSQSTIIKNFSDFLVFAVPVTEIVVSLLLFFPRSRILGLFSSLLLMITFTIYLSYIILFADKLPCTCGGVISEMSWGQHIVFNMVFIGLATIGIRLHRQLQSSSPVAATSAATFF